MANPRPAAKSLADVRKNALKTYNLSVGSLSQISEPADFITTGNLAIDHVLGGGIALGRSYELYGPPSCGKTTTALQTAAALQKLIKAGGDEKRGILPTDHILYMDYEQALDERYANALGLDLEDETFLFSQPDTLEDGANFAKDAIPSGEIRLVIWDSVAAMTPSAKMDAEIGKSLPAVAAKLLADMTQAFNPILWNAKCASIYLNHEGEVMDMGMARRPGMPARKSTPGGKSIKFFSSARVQFTQMGQNKETVIDPITQETIEEISSIDTQIYVQKNKVARPMRKAKVRVRFGRGFDNFWSAMQVLTAHKKIMVQGGYHYFHKLEAEGFAPEWMARAKTGINRPYILGEKALYEMADRYPEWRQGLIDLAVKTLDEYGEQMELESKFDPETGATLDDQENILPEEIDELVPRKETSNTKKITA